MKRILFAFGIILITMPLVFVPASAVKPGPAITMTILNPPAQEPLVLAVGQSYTFNILLTSDQPFNLAMARVTMQYPGKGVVWHSGSDIVKKSTTALLHLTVIGKSSTAGLPAVSGWPVEGIDWPAGVAPQEILAGARFQGGMVSSDGFLFSIRVP